MEKLPLEITANILLSVLPIFSQLRCREVCKTWETLVPKPKKMGLLYGVSHNTATEFAAEFYFSEQNNDNDEVSSANHIHEQLRCFGTLTLDHSFFMPSSSVFKSFMVGSCNGLVCYAGLVYYGDYPRKLEIMIYVCNPLTGEHMQLPTVKWIGSGSISHPAIGFGYNRSSNDYKVVLLRDNIFRVVQVYTLQRGNVWRYKNWKSNTYLLSDLSVLPSAGVFAGGALYWIDQASTRPNVLAFNLNCEMLALLPSIPSVGHDVNHAKLMELGDNLCAIEVVPSKQVMIWELSDTPEQGVFVYTWITKFSIAVENYGWFEPFAIGNKCLLWHNAVLSCYDPETRTLRKLEETLMKFMGDCTSSVYTTNRATPHVNSLVSLKGF